MNVMDYEISAEPGFLRARLFNRETVNETREFLRTVTSENRRHRRTCILLDVRASRPIFHVEQHGLFEHCRKLSAGPSCRIALVGDTKELCMSHDYIALLAQQQGMNVRSFRVEAEALRWLQDRRQQGRRQQDRRQMHNDRRQRDRRSGVESRASA